MLAFDYSLNPLEIVFKPIVRNPESLKFEVDRTAELIASAATRPLAVAVSGGIDSEVICQSLIKQNIDFAVFVMHYRDQNKWDYNVQDIGWAFKFCKEHNIKPVELDVDIVDFLACGALPYVDQGYVSHEIFRYLQLWLMEQAGLRGYSLIMGGREEPITRHNNCAVIQYDTGHLMCHEWNRRNGNYHYPSFFECTPELMASYYDDPLLKYVCVEPNYFVPNSKGLSPEKIMIYHREWPDLERRHKMNGFERLYPVRDQHQQALNSILPPSQNLYISIDQLRRQLGLPNLSKIA